MRFRIACFCLNTVFKLWNPFLLSFHELSSLIIHCCSLIVYRPVSDRPVIFVIIFTEVATPRDAVRTIAPHSIAGSHPAPAFHPAHTGDLRPFPTRGKTQGLPSQPRDLIALHTNSTEFLRGASRSCIQRAGSPKPCPVHCRLRRAAYCRMAASTPGKLVPRILDILLWCVLACVCWVRFAGGTTQ